MKVLPDRVRHLRRQPFLHLKAASKAVEHARELADADHLIARQIGDRRLADDRRQVVLAMRLERDVLEQHDLVIAAHLLEGAAKVARRILAIADRIFAPGAGDARGRVQQPLAVGIVAGPADQGPHRLADVVRHRNLAWLGDEIAVLWVAAVHFFASFRRSLCTAALQSPRPVESF